MYNVMLYKCPGRHEIHGGSYDYIIVDNEVEGAIDEALSQGWSYDTGSALELFKLAQAELELEAAPTREELEAKAKELEIKFDGRTSDKKLLDLITATLEE